MTLGTPPSCNKADADRSEAITSVAERLAGLSRTDFHINSFVLYAAHARSTVYGHEVFPLPGVADAAPMARFVEKRTDSKGEYNFYRLASDQIPHGGLLRAPRLFQASDQHAATFDNHRYALFIEHIEDCALSDFSTTTAHRLADAACDLSTIPHAALSGTRPRTFALDELVDRFFKAAEKSGCLSNPATRDGLRTMLEHTGQMPDVASLGLPSVPCHNDLTTRNICLPPRPREDGRFVFIDWELFGANYIGSDMSRFIILATSSPGLADFSKALQEHYYERMRNVHSVDRRTIELGAYAYASAQAMKKAINRKEAIFFEIAARVFASYYRLYQHGGPIGGECDSR